MARGALAAPRAKDFLFKKMKIWLKRAFLMLITSVEQIGIHIIAFLLHNSLSEGNLLITQLVQKRCRMGILNVDYLT